MAKIRWTCPKCEHDAYDYDEVDHECLDGAEYVAQGDEMQGAIDAYEPDYDSGHKGE